MHATTIPPNRLSSARTPIADYAMIGDCHSAALVGRDGAIDWWCAPRFDSPSHFAAMLDPDAGYFLLAPLESALSTRAYVANTMVLDTTFVTSAGTVVVTDALLLGPKETGHSIGFRSPNTIVRRVICTRGSVRMAMRVASRPEYGAITPVCSQTRGGAIIRGGAERLILSSSEPVEIDGADVVCTFTLGSGDDAIFSLSRTDSSAKTPDVASSHQMHRALRDTIKGWTTWSGLHQSYVGTYRDVVHHSGRVLQALTFQPTGAMVAAPTTSLPENRGGELNWDYRYAWLRDASMTLDALWIAACPDEAERYFSWLAHAGSSRTRDGSLQIMYGVGGEHDLTERELPHLRGWFDSRPVRVGNGAWTQNQNDVYGAIVAAARRFADRVENFDELTRAFVVDAVEAAAARWQEPDAGIWEFREKTARYVHSTLMCWVALDAGIALAEPLGVGERIEKWVAIREEIRRTLERRGWSESRRAFVQAFDDDRTLDASSLLLITLGFLDPADQRARSTVETIARELVDERGLIRRYDGADEGAFLLCTFWLAEAQAKLGDLDAARATFETALGYANDVGLLAEEIETSTGALLGNFPQAFSHLGLVNAAWAIDSQSKH